jgi:hypothetical protein
MARSSGVGRSATGTLSQGRLLAFSSLNVPTAYPRSDMHRCQSRSISTIRGSDAVANQASTPRSLARSSLMVE